MNSAILIIVWTRWRLLITQNWNILIRAIFTPNAHWWANQARSWLKRTPTFRITWISQCIWQQVSLLSYNTHPAWLHSQMNSIFMTSVTRGRASPLFFRGHLPKFVCGNTHIFVVFRRLLSFLFWHCNQSKLCMQYFAYGYYVAASKPIECPQMPWKYIQHFTLFTFRYFLISLYYNAGQEYVWSVIWYLQVIFMLRHSCIYSGKKYIFE